MAILKNRIIYFFIFISAIILVDLVSFEIALPANEIQIVIDENLKPGMTLKDAFELLGTPEKIKMSSSGTIIIPYDSLGLSLEAMNDGTVIETIHVHSSFKGRFASGVKIGAGFQEILSAYNQPDMMTKEIIEYSDLARKFQIHEGKLTGAVLFSGTSTLSHQITIKEPAEYKEVVEEVSEKAPQEVHEEVREEVREELREELRQEVREELREEAIKGYSEDFDVFELYGFKVNYTSSGVIISEIRPGSVAEKGGLQVGEAVRKAFYDGAGKMNIYSVSGLEKILKRSVLKHKKTINILQDKNYYYKVEVPMIY